MNRANVVLLHGIGRTSAIMNAMASYLSLHGFETHNIGYPSTKHRIQTLANIVRNEIEPLFASPQPLHFVCHSMGALLTRYLLSKKKPSNLGRVVMLAPPNHGTRLVNWLRTIWLFKKIYGPAALQMAADAKGFWHRLPPVDYETGIIAGDHAIDWLFWLCLQKPNDGKVTVASTKVAGMKSHIVLPVSHPFVPQDRSVKRQTAVFLKTGRFL